MPAFCGAPSAARRTAICRCAQRVGDKRVHAGAHRVVYWHFKGPIPEGIEVNHDNGQKADNRPRNLLLSTSSGNAEHAHRSGLIDQYGQKNPSAKLSDKGVAEIRLAYSKGGYTQAQLAEQYGVSHQTVSKVVRGQRRPKQLGPVRDADHRYASRQDPHTGRFVGKKSAGRLLDGRTHDGFPGGQP
jgi:DNA-binding XRE family transcriptional regulator